jgi:hypothetical protein
MRTSQKFHCQDRCSETNPPATGAKTGPRKLPAENNANGTERLSWGQISVMDPPELVTVGEPKNPEKKRNIIKAAILGANAQPI